MLVSRHLKCLHYWECQLHAWSILENESQLFMLFTVESNKEHNSQLHEFVLRVPSIQQWSADERCANLKIREWYVSVWHMGYACIASHVRNRLYARFEPDMIPCRKCHWCVAERVVWELFDRRPYCNMTGCSTAAEKEIQILLSSMLVLHMCSNSGCMERFEGVLAEDERTRLQTNLLMLGCLRYVWMIPTMVYLKMNDINALMYGW